MEYCHILQPPHYCHYCQGCNDGSSLQIAHRTCGTHRQGVLEKGVGRGSLGFQLTNGQPDQTLVITYWHMGKNLSLHARKRT